MEGGMMSKRTVFFGQDVHAALDAERVLECVASKRYPGCFESDSLCRWQSEVFQRGFRGACLSETIFGWSVRSDTGLENFRILAGHRSGELPNATKEQALEGARNWQAEAPTLRYVTD